MKAAEKAQEELADASARLRTVQSRIEQALKRSGRPVDSAKLTAVTKQRSASEIENLILAGQDVFGENRVQEAAGKWPILKAKHPGISLRLIGPLQTNKVRDACKLFDAIETLDRPSLAAALSKEFKRTGVSCDLYVQVNVGEEPQKAGVSLDEVDEFIKLCREGFGLMVSGLMCIPPAQKPAAPFFALLSEIARRNDLSHLSMGMSSDYETALQLGATRVRVGTALFEKPR
jgi:pyridoxal phosphate enzyme (YggS family)